MKSSETVYRRCRLALGTFVEVSLIDLQSQFSPLKIQNLFDDVFHAIQNVAQIMSFHDPDSDLSRLNRSEVGQWVEVPTPLVEVLSLALDLQNRTNGCFNVAVGGPLIHWDLLPGEKAQDGGWPRSIEPSFEIQGTRVRKLVPVQIDLGGIAKGFAVDCAIDVLWSFRDRLSACVNAGGDLRAFGEWEYPVWVRPGEPGHPQEGLSMSIKNRSLATSSVTLKENPQLSRSVSAYVDTQNREPYLLKKTAVVLANRCVIADAFTKIALLCPDLNEVNKLAFKYEAEASWVT